MRVLSWPLWAEKGKYARIVRYTEKYWQGPYADCIENHKSYIGRVGKVDMIPDREKHWIGLRGIRPYPAHKSVWTTEYEECEPATEEDFKEQECLDRLLHTDIYE